MAESHREEIAKLESLYASNPGGRVFVHLAEALRKAGELERARSILTEGLSRHPDSASGYVVLGRVMADLEAPDEADAAFRQVLALDSGNLVALRGLGDIARFRGRRQEAIGYYRDLLNRTASNDEVRSLVALLEADLAAKEAEAADEASGSGVALDEPDAPYGRPDAPAEPFAAAPVADELPGLPSEEAAGAGLDAPAGTAPEYPQDFEVDEPEQDPGVTSFEDAFAATADAADGSADDNTEFAVVDTGLLADDFDGSVSTGDALLEDEDALDIDWEALENAGADAEDDEPEDELLDLLVTGENPRDTSEPDLEVLGAWALAGDAGESSAAGDDSDAPAAVDEGAATEDAATADDSAATDDAAIYASDDHTPQADAGLPVLDVGTDEAATDPWAAPMDAPADEPYGVHTHAHDVAGWETVADDEASAAAAPDVDEPAAANTSDQDESAEAPYQEFAASEPEFAASEPEFAASEPEFAASEPEFAASEPESGASEPESGTSEPESAATGQEMAVTEPADADSHDATDGVEGFDVGGFGGALGGPATSGYGLQTETMADLYMSQGFHHRAAEVYRTLLQQRPDDEGLAAKLRDAESGSRTAGSAAESLFEEDEAGEAWLRGSAWTGSGDSGDEATPYTWTESEEEVSEPAGPPIGSYLQALIGWRPAASPDAPAGLEDAKEPVPATPQQQAAGEAPRQDAPMPWEESSAGPGAPADVPDAPAPAADSPAGRDASEDAPWLAYTDQGTSGNEATGTGDAADEAEPWAMPAGGGGERAAAKGSDAESPGGARGRADDVQAAFDDWFGPPETGPGAAERNETGREADSGAVAESGPAQAVAASATPGEAAVSAATGAAAPETGAATDEEDEDLEMFRSWLQSLKR
jgi:tetratricopeptide (TPR) repeat protein